MFKNGLVHVYFGDGQGKTSAAVGLAVRACGGGCRVLFVQFLKNCRSGELTALRSLGGNIETLTPRPCVKFLFDMDEQERMRTAEDQNACFQDVKRKVQCGGYDLLVLDEAMDAVNLGILDRSEFLAFICNRPRNLEVVVTGHEVTEGLQEMVDYVSEIRKVKHPYDKGIKARAGIDM